MIINVWIGVRDDAQALINERLTWDENTRGAYRGPITNRQVRLFSLMDDHSNRQKLFRVDRVGARDWTIWSIYFNFARDALTKIKDELDQLAADFPAHIAVLGAWHFESGEQIKQGGSPIYPFHTRLLNFIPDKRDADGASLGRPTISDMQSDAKYQVNLIQGQAPRKFS